MSDIKQQMRECAQRVKVASQAIVSLDADKKNAILCAWADELNSQRENIKTANEKDILNGKEAGLSAALLDRLTLSDVRIDAMINGVREIATLPDNVGKEISSIQRPNGLWIRRVRVPIGVICIVYESRPNVTADAAALCFKASNAVILRGGKEAFNSNCAIWKALCVGGARIGMPEHAVELVQTVDRDAVRHLVELDGLIDLVIPRGGESLIKAVTELSRVPVIKHYKGVCHTFVDETADFDMARNIIINAKCQRPGVCNAMETLLVHERVADKFLPLVINDLISRGVEIRGDECALSIAQVAGITINVASEADWETEYLDLIISVKVVKSVEDAILHINKFGSHHSDAIVTQSATAKELFCREVDSAAVYCNASTRFTDGSEFGLGAEMGISTDKIHARGPMGVEELTTYKYVIDGAGQVRE